jgi:NAD(P)-dependent dehydrogenase (short-subunit alcohol dehydrogenase family)
MNFLNSNSADSLLELAQAYKISLITLSSLASFFYLSHKFYFSGGKCKSKARLNGKTVIITGANTGIGKETALDMARRGARVIMACRDLQKALNAADEIRKKTGNGNVFVEMLDLASMDSIRKFSQKINAQEERIDILINNAGIMMCPKWRTKDGFEMQFGTNHLGHFLLTNLLLDKIKKTGASRIVSVSSLAHERGRMRWDDLMSDKSYDPQEAYRQSKLANVLFTRELAERLKGTNVTTYSLHPGVIRTELGRYLSDSFGWKAYLIKFVFAPLSLFVFKNPTEGAQTTIHCAVDENITNLSGAYFSDCAPKQLLPHAFSDQDAKKLWQISEELTRI